MRKLLWVAGTSSLLFACGIAAQLSLGVDALSSVTTGSALIGESAIDAQVRAALNNELKLAGVTAEIEDGIATLEGTVPSQAEKDRVERLARTMDGVARVRNEIVVGADVSATAHAGNPVTPRSVDTAVLANLRADMRFADRSIDVTANNRNVVTLTGEVASEEEKDVAGRIAARTHSVNDVRNRLVVRGK